MKLSHGCTADEHVVPVIAPQTQGACTADHSISHRSIVMYTVLLAQDSQQPITTYIMPVNVSYIPHFETIWLKDVLALS